MKNDLSKEFDSVTDAINAIAAGEIVVVTDDEDRENEGDLVMAASKATPEAINTMIREARGLICVPTVEHHLKRLGINPMVANNREGHGTDFTVSVDAAEGITTGISAADRCHTIRILGDPDATADQLVQPGHIFPLRARPGGVLQRAGHTEAAVDLTTMAGHSPVAVICEILNEDGTMARLPQLVEFKKKHRMRMVSIRQLIEYRHSREKLVDQICSYPVQLPQGTFELHSYRSLVDGSLHFALTMGIMGPEPTLVRVQSQNLLQDVFQIQQASQSGTTIHSALSTIAEKGTGAFVYITQPMGGLQLSAKGPDATSKTVENTTMDFRGYGIGAQILAALGLRKIRLLSSSNRRHIALDGYGLEIVDQR